MFRRRAVIAAVAGCLALAPPVAVAEEVVRSGLLLAENGHQASGEVALINTGAGYEIRLSDDFSAVGGADPQLGFGDPVFDPDTIFSPLRSESGAQTYPLPASFDPATVTTFYVWCQEFDLSIAMARLSR